MFLDIRSWVASLLPGEGCTIKLNQEVFMRWIKITALLMLVLVSGALFAFVLTPGREGVAAQVRNAVDGAVETLSQSNEAAEPQVQSAIDGVLQAFDSYPVVAIGDEHGVEQLGEFYQALLRSPEFAKKVDALVLEYGNARYQELVDRYVNGEDVPYAELQKVWSDAVGKQPGPTEVMYPQLFAAVRAVNQSLPDDQKLRILLGDPPIDWSAVKSREDVQRFQSQRDTHFAQVVTGEVLDKGLKALVIIGRGHLDRGQPSNQMQAAGESQQNQLQPMPGANGDAAPAGQPQMRQMPQSAGGKAGLMQQIVEAKYPGRTFVILVHTGFADDACNARLEERMAGWQAPSLALVEGSWLESIECQKFPAMVLKQRPGSSAGNAPANNAPAPAQAQMRALPGQAGQASPLSTADGYLYLGPRESLTMSPVDPVIYLDQEYFAEQSRRRELLSGEPLNWQEVSRGNPRRFVDKFSR
jgi:hypothetical protein